MKSLALLPILSASYSVLAHGGHNSPGPSDGETMQEYAEKHMASEHHIEAFDVASFFQLHDLNRDGYWDKDEIEAVYGVHHAYSQKVSFDDIGHQKKAEHIVKVVLENLDKNNDGKITVEELEAVGLKGLPNFDHLGAEGHHYDIESEFFLHHEEQFHSTPETQTDESYNHPEDIAHFAHHEHIEMEEMKKEAQYEGVPVAEVVKEHEDAEAAADAAAAQAAKQKPMYTREPSPDKVEPGVKFAQAAENARNKGEWGAGDAGYLPPADPSDKMRKNMPYKSSRMQYKFKRSWNDF
ncbi:hypothetical protein CYLTODRAFT_434295 [Cylindrobasidium torrendii FP15055 ss-10]|uniref:EF-hand domain-containing protein n=1 Tax=Cylindrobasidium torrendii FP15055 ss-10 TaxID=1314674 RepID=A0A0D7BUX4_9AGAR|nr:hypothetical protein CYLTODRAFT_434295 [Cylindrobasidium torrendii FP15055 ss-10]